jgi:exonuclease III
VTILLNETASKCVISTEAYEDRIIMVKLQAQPVDIVIIQVYMPTTSHDYEEVEKLYEKLSEMMKKVKGTDYLVVMGDWNAVVGEETENKCVGGYGLGQKNSRGKILIAFCKQQQLIVTNTWFKQPKRRRYTWKAPGDTARYQIDYIMVKERYRNSVKSSHAYPGPDADTDHNLVLTTIFLTLKQVKWKKTRKKWDREKLEMFEKGFADAVDKELRSGITGNAN